MNNNFLKAGAGSAEIIYPAEMFPTDGFGGVHDNPRVTALILEGTEKMILMSVELVVVATPFVKEIKKIVNGITGIPAEKIWVHGTHPISTPHAPGPKFRPGKRPEDNLTEEQKIKRPMFINALYAAVTEAVEKANADIKKVTYGFGRGFSDVKDSCRIKDVERGLKKETDETCVVNKEFRLIRFNDETGKTAAVVVNFGMTGNVLDNTGMETNSRVVSSDAIGKACRVIEQQIGAPALYFMSAGADQCPREQALYDVADGDGNKVRVDKGVEVGLELVDMLGNEFAKDVIEVVNNVKCDVCDPTINAEFETFECLNKPNDQGGPEKAELSLLTARIGNIGLMGTNGEFVCASELEFFEKSPFADAMFISMVDGPKNVMADIQSFDCKTAEGRRSFSARGEAERLIEASVDSLKRFKS